MSGVVAPGLEGVPIAESGISFVLKPPGWPTYPIVFMDLVHFGFVALLSALALVQLVVCLVPAIAAAAVLLRAN